MCASVYTMLLVLLLHAFIHISLSLPRDRLYDAVFNADVDFVRDLLAEWKKDPALLTPGSFPTDPRYAEKEHGRTALMMCGYKDADKLDYKHRMKTDRACLSIAKDMKAAGADMSHVDNYGWCVLSMAAIRGLTLFSEYLIQHGAPVNLQDNDEGQSPLMKALAHGYIDTAQMLLKNGASLTQRDTRGRTPLLLLVGQAMADRRFQPKLEEFLNIAFAARSTDGIDTAASTGTGAAGKTEKGKQGKKGKGGETGGREAAAGAPTTAGEDPTPAAAVAIATVDFPADSNGRTALHYAVIGRSLAVARILLDAGADPTLSDNFGKATMSMVRDAEVRAADAIQTNNNQKEQEQLVKILQEGAAAAVVRKHAQWQQSSEPVWEDL